MDSVVRFSLYKWRGIPPVTKCCKCGSLLKREENRVVLIQLSEIPDIWEVECMSCHKLEEMEW